MLRGEEPILTSSVVSSVFEIGDLRFEGPPDFVADVGENVVMLINIDRNDPAWDKLRASAPVRRRSEVHTDEHVDRLHELLDEGEVVRLRLVGSDAEVYAVRVAEEEQLPAAAKKRNPTGARKAKPRKAEPRPEQ